MSIDEAIEKMQRDELEDIATEQEKMTPRDYATLRGIAPQRIYYYLRHGRITKETCPCGRRVVDIKACDIIFGFSEAEEEDKDG